MTSTIKNLLIVGGLIAAGSIVLTTRKVTKLVAIFDKMTIKPSSFPRNIRLSFQQIRFNIDIVLANPTREDFAVSGYVATLTQVAVFYKDNFLGVANVSIDEISVPAYRTLILKDIDIAVATSTALNAIPGLITQMQTMSFMDDLKFTGVVEVLGSYYEIGN